MADPTPRSTGLARTEALSDGVFAIALTLLVLAIDRPTIPAGADDMALLAALLKQGHEIVSFFISVAVVGYFWFLHQAFFARLRSLDGPMMALNIVYLALVAFLPYPQEIVGDFPDHWAAVMLYAVVLTTLGGVQAAMFRYGARSGLVHGKPDRRSQATLETLIVLLLASIPVAYWSPRGAVAIWLLVWPFHFVSSVRRPGKDPPAPGS